MRKKMKQVTALLLSAAMCFCTGAAQASPVSEKQTEASPVPMAEKDTDKTEHAKISGMGQYRITLPAEEGVSYTTDQGQASDIHEGEEESVMPATSPAVSFSKEKGEETEKSGTKETETDVADRKNSGIKKLETEAETKKDAENPVGKATEKVTEKETEKEAISRARTVPEEDSTQSRETKRLGFKIKGDAYANIYYGISIFEDAIAHKGKRNTFTDTCNIDLTDIKDGKVWVYAQSTGSRGYAETELPEGVERSTLKSMPGMGGHIFLLLDVSKYEGQDGTVAIEFAGAASNTSRCIRAAGSFNTSTVKKLTGLTYTWKGGQPSMYESKPATGESSIWGNGTWTVPRPSVDTVCSLFGVTKPEGARFNNVGTDGSGQVYMRCTGVSDIGSHNGLSGADAYIQCISIDEDDGEATYTFRIWGANGGRGQTTEGYIQMTSRTPKDTDIRLEKTVRTGSLTDLLGNTTTGSKSGARFRLFKLNSAGAKKIADDHNRNYDTNSEWWAAHESKEDKKTIMTYVEKLMLNGNASPGDTEKNPNPSYFKYAGTYTTDESGKTDLLSVETGASDYYVLFERKAPDGMSLGYSGTAGVPSGKHYFYKVFSAYGDGSIIMRDAEGNETKDTDNDLTVKIADEPLLVDITLKKSFKENETPEMKGLSWKDFEFLVSDNASFTGKVKTIPLAGPTTVIRGFFSRKKYYLKENPDSPACRSTVGYVASPHVYSFYPEDDGGVTYSDSHPIEVDAIEAVDAYKHTFFSIPNDSTTAPVKLIKRSSVPEITKDNRCYSLAGATYEIYQKASMTAPNTDGIKRGVLVTDENGISNIIEDIPTGYYYAVETVAPKGFQKNKEAIPFIVVKGKTNEVPAEDIPFSDPVSIILRKQDSETDSGAAQGAAVLEGAEYTIKYYDGYYGTEEEIEGLVPVRTWVFRTDKDGKVDLDRDKPISGDELYTNEHEEITFPLGTITIQETRPPEGYQLDPSIHVYRLEREESNSILEEWNTAIVTEEPVRGDFRMMKVSDDGTPLADVPFQITSITTGESHIIVTDKEGMLDTSKPHSSHTNRGETAEDGIWFGDLDVLDDKKGALLYDTYRVEELLCENNKEKFMLEPFTVEIKEDSVTKELDPAENETKEAPKLKTTAADNESQTHDAYVNGTTTITDVVEYDNLEVGREYTFNGYLVLKDSGEPLLDEEGNKITDSVTITVPEANEDTGSSSGPSGGLRYGKGTVELTFTFDSSLLKGKKIVVFEDLYLDKYHVASHADINDEGQTVGFRNPQVSTKASDKKTGRHYAPLTKEATIVDEVSYRDLIPGHTYKLSGILMDKATGEPLLVNGVQVAEEKEFTPGAADGTVCLEYTLDSTVLEDVSTVVFETLYYKDREIASHADLSDENQEVYFTDVDLKTTAKDQETGLNDGIISEKTTVVDTVHYTGLIPGRAYTVKGILMDKGTGKPLLADGHAATSSATFTAKEKDGSVDIIFTFDSSLLAGKSIVAFETMYQNDREVAIHADIGDNDQTVTFHKPSIVTTATEKELEGHEAFVDKKTVITDTVHYTDLVPGVEYTVTGILMHKETKRPVKSDGRKVTSTVAFKPGKTEGDVDVIFNLDSTALAGKTTVVYETLYLGKREIASHAEIGDKRQAVSFRDVKLATSASGKESGTKEIKPADRVTVTDKVSYSGLIAGKKYTVTGKLMDKESGKPLKAGGKEVTATKTFQAEKAKGTTEMKFTFDASALAGKKLVVFERLSFNGREIAVHADLKDGEQTVSVKKAETQRGATVPASPKTGDVTKVLPYIILVGIAAAVILLEIMQKRTK